MCHDYSDKYWHSLLTGSHVPMPLLLVVYNYKSSNLKWKDNIELDLK
jgi:hypothetical protein